MDGQPEIASLWAPVGSKKGCVNFSRRCKRPILPLSISGISPTISPSQLRLQCRDKSRSYSEKHIFYNLTLGPMLVLCRGRGLSVKYGWAHKSKSPSQPLFRKANYFYSAINNDLSAAHTNLRAKVIIFLLLVIVQQAKLNAHILLQAGKTK